MSKHGIGKKYGLRQYWSIPSKISLDLAINAGNLGTILSAGALGAFITSIGTTAVSEAILTPLNRFWLKLFTSSNTMNTRWWQMVGGFNVTSDTNIKDVLNELREDYKDELGEDFTFNLLQVVIPTKILRLLVTLTSKGYILVIDEKEKEIESINLKASNADLKELESVIKNKGKDKSDDEKKDANPEEDKGKSNEKDVKDKDTKDKDKD